MKQIFEWLREQIEENSVMECYTNIISSNMAKENEISKKDFDVQRKVFYLLYEKLTEDK